MVAAVSITAIIAGAAMFINKDLIFIEVHDSIRIAHQLMAGELKVQSQVQHQDFQRYRRELKIYHQELSIYHQELQGIINI